MNDSIEDLNPFLKPTKLINSRNPQIKSKVKELIEDKVTPVEKAEKLFYFTRDHIRYAFHADSEESDYYASSILKKMKGFCTQKAILFCALARAAGIPAGIYFFDIVDHTLPTFFVDLLRTRTLYRHGITALYLNGKWIKYDATLDIQLVRRNKLVAVEYSLDHDCLMHDKTAEGKKHIEYVQDYGLYPDVTFAEINSWFKKHYSHVAK